MTPDQHTNQELMLPVDNGHELYVQDWGNPAAKIPVIYLHGGPGSGTSNRHRKYFDPVKQRVIFFDQRGSGNSLPFGAREHNTTQDLIADIEKVAQHFDLDTFILAGGSWGSTLALAYGIAHPERVANMVLNGILTGAQDEIDWLDKGGFKEFFPDVWQQYIESVPPEHQQNPSGYHFEKAFGNDPEATKKSAHAYESLEMALLKLDDQLLPPDFETYDPASILIEMNYLRNGCYLPDNYIFENASKLTMPISMVQGRYDMICRPAIAAKLNDLLPNSRIVWTINGHSGQHESITVQRLLLLEATGDK